MRYVAIHVACLLIMFCYGRLAMPLERREKVRHATLLFCALERRVLVKKEAWKKEGKMNDRFEDKLRSVRYLKDKGETSESLRLKTDEQIVISLDLLGIGNIDNEFINSIKKAFDILYSR